MANKKIKTRIPENELSFRTSKSSGPGGQHVNKTNTKVTLFFNLAQSRAFADWQKKRIFKKLGSRINSDRCLVITSQQSRSQHKNKTDAINKLTSLLSNALKKQPRRKKTRPTRASIEKRLSRKKHHGRIKKLRAEKLTQ